ncbi:MAG: cyclic nucleotide-binding domain-containing protein [Panacagrimonas sp.]
MTSELDAADLVHLGYALMLCALIARDVLWLRAILAAAQFTLSAYAWFTDRPGMAAWNALFVLINFLWVLRILHERRAVELPPELRQIHARHFAAFAPQEFLRFWKLGRSRDVTDALLVQTGQRPAELLFLVDGSAQVRLGQRPIAALPSGSFVAEMSLITDSEASADVHAQGPVRLQTWPMAQVRNLRVQQPLLWPKLQSALGQDLVEKIRRQSAGKA